MSAPRTRFTQLLSIGVPDRPLVDLGSSSLTAAPKEVVDAVDPDTAPLRHPDATVDTGDAVFRDRFGVGWLISDGEPALLDHPLATADQWAIARWAPERSQHVDDVGDVVNPVRPGAIGVLDAGVPGIFDLACRLRGAWQLLDDLVDNWRIAATLLDRALDVVTEEIVAAIEGSAQQPGLIVYGDDVGFATGMLIGPEEYRRMVRPRTAALLSRIRAMTPAPILLHSCGAIAPIIDDMAAFEVELLKIDPGAVGLPIADLRRRLPASTVLHGPTDPAAIAVAAVTRDRAAVAREIDAFARAWPAIASPLDSISGIHAHSVATGLSMLRLLDGDDIATVRAVGPTPALVARISGAAEPCLDTESTNANR